MKEKSIKKNIAYSTLYQILTIITPFITAPYISRVIGSAGIGIYSYTLSIETYFAMFASLGTISYGAREIARNRYDKEVRSKLFWEIEILTIITSIISLIAWAIFIGISKDYKVYYIILTLNLLNTMFDISWFYAGMEEFKYTVLQNTIFKILGIASLFLFVKGTSDLDIYMIIMCGGTFLGTISMWLYLPKFIQKVKYKNLKIWPHFKETIVYFIPTIATSIYTVLDKTLIGLITKSEMENGFYEQASKIVNMTKALTFSSINLVLGSRMSYLFSTDKIKEIHTKIDKSMNYILFMGFGTMFGLIAVADNFIPLFFGNGYDRVIGLAKLMSPLVIIIGISNCLGSQYYSPAGFRAKSNKYIIMGSIVNLILNLLLIPKFWSYGAIAATILAEGTISYLYLKNCDGFLTWKKICFFAYKKVIAGLIMLIVVLIIGMLNINVYGLMVLQVLSGVLTYILCLFILKDKFVMDIYNNEFKKIIKKLKKK